MGEKNPFVPVHVECEIFPLIPESEIQVIHYKGQPPVVAYYVSRAQIEALLKWHEKRKKMYSPWAKRNEDQKEEPFAKIPLPVQAPGESLYEKLSRLRKVAGG
ncbi:MAG: hypothetical protein IMW96_11400 [Thermoanaerobacteraceae bacterium]|nr:hypothetical protein [Thermoanaerobacteraceae bacterium]